MSAALAAEGGRLAACMARCERLRGAALRDVLGRAQGILFDCDGVLWNGERAVPGAPELLERLARAGKAALFVSNNSRRARPELALRFARLGFGGLRAEQLFSSALCAARLLRQRLLGPPEAPGTVFVLGGEGLRAELRAAGLRLAGDPGGDPGAGNATTSRVRAVVVGYDEHFSFAKLSEACAHLRDPDCLLVATDRDPWHPLSDGSRTPGTGSLAAAVETASGRQALVVGKPSPYMFECITEHFSIDPARMLMVGDRLETDILFGHRCGMTTVLTLTGVSCLEEAQAYLAAGQHDLVPHYYVESIADLMEGLED
ncbi:pyridoxal phosphate phosphatase isoform X1 [Otolemur garnettii]|uniref:pyridoxal phosphate phosphatase isoform X1 n=1 Tax=Otolemur garnettii TaxID=30611 RepID=UPI000644396D|nr:pyridoxal phosphate phosphatase isoform X1 [Otolemur garnettii]